MEDMNRREFLKALGIVSAAALAVPSVLIAENKYPGFDPNKQCGDYVTVTDYFNPKDPNNDPVVRECLSLLDEEIAEVIPPKYRSAIRYRYIEPQFLSAGIVSWNYSPRRIDLVKKNDPHHTHKNQRRVEKPG